MIGRLGGPRGQVRSGVDTPETERIEVPAPAPLELPVPATEPGPAVQPAGVPA
jgi:hypothetical protein